jgi:hypothetical protein
VVEEIAKGLVLVLLYFWREDEFDGVIDGIVYAGMVGLGFAMLENIQYYGMAAFYGGAELGGRMFILRGLMAPFAHPLFTSLTGLALGMARRTRGRAKRLALGLVGLALASGMHAMWNLSALRGGEAFQATYLFIMVPIFVFGLGVIVVELRREGRMVVLHLQRERDSGLLTAEEHARLGSVMARVSRRWRALRQGGRPSWRAAGRLHQLAGELALHRQRVALGVVEINEETRTIEAAYVVEIEVLIRTLPPRGTGA